MWTPLWFVAIGIGYLVIRRRPGHHALRESHAEKVAQRVRQG
ncbi:hypothetical protein [Yimella lutea]|nr:hypothetical protein [Yimella lutea]